jgi:hypothetical protein
LPKKLDCPQLGLFVLELFAAFASEEGSASLDDVAHVTRPQLNEVIFEETRIAVTHTENLPAPVNPRANDGPDRGIHPGCVASAGQYGNSVYSHFSREAFVERLTVTADPV